MNYLNNRVYLYNCNFNQLQKEIDNELETIAQLEAELFINNPQPNMNPESKSESKSEPELKSESESKSESEFDSVLCFKYRYIVLNIYFHHDTIIKNNSNIQSILYDSELKPNKMLNNIIINNPNFSIEQIESMYIGFLILLIHEIMENFNTTETNNDNPIHNSIHTSIPFDMDLD
jgi:hypothetical protein